MTSAIKSPKSRTKAIFPKSRRSRPAPKASERVFASILEHIRAREEDEKCGDDWTLAREEGRPAPVTFDEANAISARRGETYERLIEEIKAASNVIACAIIDGKVHLVVPDRNLPEPPEEENAAEVQVVVLPFADPTFEKF